jgi:hypothetical protein
VLGQCEDKGQVGADDAARPPAGDWWRTSSAASPSGSTARTRSANSPVYCNRGNSKYVFHFYLMFIFIMYNVHVCSINYRGLLG